MNTSYCFSRNSSARFTSHAAEFPSQRRRLDEEVEGEASALPARDKDKDYPARCCCDLNPWQKEQPRGVFSVGSPSADKRRYGWGGQGGCMISAFLPVPAQPSQRGRSGGALGNSNPPPPRFLQASQLVPASFFFFIH